MTARPLQGMFAKVSDDYDRLNRILTWALDGKWRRIAVDVCLEAPAKKILDLCTGTGDLALALGERTGDMVKITAADFSRPMLDVARLKAAKFSYGSKIEFVHADAANLPFETDSFDVIGIAFGFRNLTYRNPNQERHLIELARVMAPKGRLVILETSQPRFRLLRLGFHMYLAGLVGPLGGLLSRQAGAYRYLAQSARGFYRPEEIKELLYQAGFSATIYRPLAGGVAGVHISVL